MADMILTPEELDRIVRNQIEINRTAKRESPAQIAIDRCVEAVHADGELELAALVMLCSGAGLPATPMARSRSSCNGPLTRSKRANGGRLIRL